MNKRERFYAYLNNEPVDRAPVGFFHHYTTRAEYLKGLSVPEYFEKMVIMHRLTKQQDDPDFLKIMNDVLMLMPVDVSMVKEPKDLVKIVPPRMDSEYVKKTRELTLRVREYYEDEDIPSLATSFAPLFNIRHAMNRANRDHPEIMRDFFLEDPESAVKAMKIVAERTNEIHHMLMDECGVDGIYFSVNNQNHIVPDDFYTKYVAPIEIDMIKDIKKHGVCVLHICGYEGLSNNLELYKDYPATAMNWGVYAEGVSLREGKKFFGGKPVMGGFAQDTIIYRGTKDEIKDEVKRILSETGDVGVRIGADCTVPNDIDEKHFAWAREAAAEFARNKE